MEINLIEYKYKEVLGKTLRQFQKAAIEKLLDEVKSVRPRPRPLLVRLPTGYGKTIVGESLLVYETVNGVWSYARGLTYVLPTRAITHDVAERIKEDLSGFGIKDVKEIHGESDSTDFYADVSVATFDTFLYAFARKTHDYHLERPAGVIATSYVVFDEAHMLQDEYLYSHKIMGKLVSSLHEAGIPIVVMTATLPRCIEDTIFKRVGEPLRIPENLDEFRESVFSYRGSVENVLVKKDMQLFDYIKSSDFYYEMKQKRRVLLVTNTVSRAIEAFKTIKGRVGNDWKVILLHSRLRLRDRRDREEIVRKLLQPATDNSDISGVVVVATQVVEAGLDVSCKLLVTECAPADALVQRVGRCARREGEKEGTCVILKPINYEPYPSILIDRTLTLLNEMSENERVESLTTLKFSNDFINESYRGFEPEEIPERFKVMRDEMETTLRYLESIYPFIVDREAIGRVKARSNAPVFIFAPTIDETIKAYLMVREGEEEKGHYKLKEICKGTINELIQYASKLQKSEALFIDKEIVRERTFTIESAYLSGKFREAITFCEAKFNKSFIVRLLYTRRSLLDVDVERKALFYKLEIIQNKGQRIHEGTYVLNPEFYHLEYGLVG